MSTVGDPGADVELARQRRRQRRRRRRRRESVSGRSETTTDGSRYFSDSGDDHQLWQSTSGSVACGSLDECRFPEIERETASRRQQKLGRETLTKSEEDIDLEIGELEMKVHAVIEKREERDCRICHLRLVGDIDDDEERDVAIELGCCCKGDLGASHKQCAETWFKIKGNTVCEICGAIAVNVVLGELPNEPVITVVLSNQTVLVDPPTTTVEAHTFWHGRRVMNALLTCLVLAFVISWLFHFNVRPKN
ncbi:uncharacterized protein LOC124917368 [Impatiens glandulifera]|uniref:uncharacterized protein LOC124917368 n=1 Tax=Impatiens glandulifera TaxID=253017 RepID=UPI001FB09424|nr:uncharacterized protein LOC124917368 [Impatiens glandulifera]